MRAQVSKAKDASTAMLALSEDGHQLSTKMHDLATQTHSHGARVAEHVADLASQSRRIDAVSELIRDIANKTDLLAVNASVEGSRGGEAGRKFTKIAKQMQRIASAAIEAVEEMALVSDEIRQATAASVLASEEASKRAQATIDSANQGV